MRHDHDDTVTDIYATARINSFLKVNRAILYNSPHNLLNAHFDEYGDFIVFVPMDLIFFLQLITPAKK